MSRVDLPEKTQALRKSMKDEKAIPRAKVKSIKMTLTIICVFIMCWTPYFVVHLIHIWSNYTYQIPDSVYALAETMALWNSALNPILYGCFNVKTSCPCGRKIVPRVKQQAERTSNTHPLLIERKPESIHASPNNCQTRTQLLQDFDCSSKYANESEGRLENGLMMNEYG